jgi:DNA-damage-inducible protein D
LNKIYAKYDPRFFVNQFDQSIITLMDKPKTIFDEIKQLNDSGDEFWFARELMSVLGYMKWERFLGVIKKAQDSLRSTGGSVDNQFPGVGKIVLVGSGSKREVSDYKLTRYACYLVAMNGDSRKKPIALAQQYFASQTRQNELAVQREADLKRLDARKKLSESEKKLAGIVMDRGVDRFGLAEIKSSGDKAFFGGKSTQDMKKRLGVKGKKPLADVLPTITIGAKFLATEITNVKTVQDNLKGKEPIKHEHILNNEAVRQVLLDRGIKPESLLSEEDVKKVGRRLKNNSRIG